MPSPLYKGAFNRDVEEKVNWPNGPREAGLDHAIPYSSMNLIPPRHTWLSF